MTRSADAIALGDDELCRTPVGELAALGGARRLARFGRRVTYSPKVFVALTMLCRDRCGYCTFAKQPARLAAPFLGPDEVVAIATAGRDAGCHEALFTLGEAPEDRYPIARAWLEEHRYGSTVDYLAAAAAAVYEESGLLVHCNAGALSEEDLATLRPVSVSQGMMLESLAPGLACHRLAPDKAPARRLATLEAAGRLAIPFTTGVLVGVGETRRERLDVLRVIADSHRRHGHVQEVLVQGFLPKPRTAMHAAPPCDPDELLWTVAAARIVLPDGVHVQSPPNLVDDPVALVEAGADDLGGISPVTIDHVNPERPWPALDALARDLAAASFELAPRLAVHPEYVADAERWLAPEMRAAVLEHADAEGLARDSTWCAGVDEAPPQVVAAGGGSRAGLPAGPVADVLAGIELGDDPASPRSRRSSRPVGPRCAAIAEYADALSRRHGRGRRHLRREPEHQLHEHLHVQVPVLRVQQGTAVAQPEGQAVPAEPRRDRRARRRGRARRGDRGLPARWHPPGFRRELLPGGPSRRARRVRPDPHPRVHRARGDRGGATPRRAPRDLPAAPLRRGPAHAARARRPRSSTTRSAPSSARTR